MVRVKRTVQKAIPPPEVIRQFLEERREAERLLEDQRRAKEEHQQAMIMITRHRNKVLDNWDNAIFTRLMRPHEGRRSAWER